MVQLAAAADVTAVPKCDGDGCQENAVMGYLWDWGEKGVCCAKHATLLQQTSANISRGVTIFALASAGPPPLLRDERTQLVARGLVLEAELEEVKARGLELYRANDQLRGSVRLLELRNAEADAQLKDARAELEMAHDDIQKRDAENANLVIDNERLRLRLQLEPGDTGHVVDG